MNTRKTLRFMWPVMVLFLVVVSSSAHAQSATSMTNTTTPFNSSIFPSCHGESIAISGHMHVIIHTTQSSDGLVSDVFHLNLQGSGVGDTTGTQYGFTQATHTTFNRHDTGALEFTLTETIHVISRGHQDDFRMRFLIHVTWNAQGQATAQVSAFERICE
jgi:hypothetical protein